MVKVVIWSPYLDLHTVPYGFVIENQAAFYQAFCNQKKLKFSALNETTRTVLEQVHVNSC